MALAEFVRLSWSDLGGLLGLFCLVIGIDLQGGTVFRHYGLHASHLMVVFFEFQGALVALGFALFRFIAILLVDLLVS